MATRLNVRRRLILILAIALLVVGGWATRMIAQVDVGTAFEIDGDIQDFPGNGLDDWVNINCPSIDSGHALIETGAVADPPGTSIFTQGGSKDKLDINNWMFTDGSVPDKDDIENAYAGEYAATGPSGPTTVLVVGGDRFSNDGSAFIGAWFFQSDITTVPPTKGNTGPFSGVHTNGDILILATFTQGGVVATPKVFEWVGSGGSCPSGPCPAPTEKGGTLADITPAPGAIKVAAGESNSVPQVIPASCSSDWSYTPKQGTPGTIPSNSFFEVGIDLGVLGLGSECFASFLLETRSSADVDAQLKDFILHSFAPCKIACNKTVAPTPICQGASATYTYEVSNPGGVDLTVNATDDNATPGNTADDFAICMAATSGDPCGTVGPCPFTVKAGETRTCTRSASPAAGSYTNKLKAVGSPANGTLQLTCEQTATLVVNPNPAVSISSFDCNASTVSNAASFMLTATPTGGSGSYSFSWNTGDTTATITKTAVGTYTVGIRDTNNCTASAVRRVGYCTDH